MLFWHKQKTSVNVASESSLLLLLLKRIHIQHIDDTQHKRLRNVRDIFSYLHICFLGLILFQCPNQIYNAWLGPFHINLDQIATQFKTHTELRYDARSVLYRWFSLDHEYLQIELGEDMIDQDMTKTFRVFNGKRSYEKLLYAFNRVRESTIDQYDYKFYVELPSNEQSYIHRRLSYNFRAFHNRTLRCIIRQLDISPMEYLKRNEKSMYIQAIEQIYDRNVTLFNIKVIIKCGILLGYLYEPNDKTVYLWDSNETYKLGNHIIVFDALSPYCPYMAYILVCLLFVRPLIKILFSLGIYQFHKILPPSFMIHRSVQDELAKSNINSIIILNNLLLNTVAESKHYDRLFIIQNKYLVMLMIDFNENNPEILRQFDKRSPFKIISIDTIKSVRHYHIVVANHSRSKYIYFPTDSYLRDSNTSEWLHQRLIHISDQYRHHLEQEQIRQHQEILRAQQQEHQHHLKALIHEEAEYQYNTYGHNFNRMWHRIASASPRFIAQFRLEDRQLVNSDQPNIECSLCYEEFRIGQHFAQWPCKAKHSFHFDCMLSALRARNTCPLCRHPVEAAYLPSRQTVLQYMAGRIIPRFFT
ncbi:unnamed protein product [Rotaria sp. Silwood2]|nr:unnamed protein product [Rotaria sp. Silwood2]CAF4277994.1 unnamed protein product [Rotaria sp. Silwood2]